MRNVRSELPHGTLKGVARTGRLQGDDFHFKLSDKQRQLVARVRESCRASSSRAARVS